MKLRSLQQPSNPKNPSNIQGSSKVLPEDLLNYSFQKDSYKDPSISEEHWKSILRSLPRRKIFKNYPKKTSNLHQNIPQQPSLNHQSNKHQGEELMRVIKQSKPMIKKPIAHQQEVNYHSAGYQNKNKPQYQSLKPIPSSPASKGHAVQTGNRYPQKSGKTYEKIPLVRVHTPKMIKNPEWKEDNKQQRKLEENKIDLKYRNNRIQSVQSTMYNINNRLTRKIILDEQKQRYFYSLCNIKQDELYEKNTEIIGYRDRVRQLECSNAIHLREIQRYKGDQSNYLRLQKIIHQNEKLCHQILERDIKFRDYAKNENNFKNQPFCKQQAQFDQHLLNRCTCNESDNKVYLI